MFNLFKRRRKRTWHNDIIDAIPDAKLHDDEWMLHDIHVSRKYEPNDYAVLWRIGGQRLSIKDSDTLGRLWSGRLHAFIKKTTAADIVAIVKAQKAKSALLIPDPLK